jgi:hypothetical protein
LGLLGFSLGDVYWGCGRVWEGLVGKKYRTLLHWSELHKTTNVFTFKKNYNK